MILDKRLVVEGVSDFKGLTKINLMQDDINNSLDHVLSTIFINGVFNCRVGNKLMINLSPLSAGDSLTELDSFYIGSMSRQEEFFYTFPTNESLKVKPISFNHYCIIDLLPATINCQHSFFDDLNKNYLHLSLSVNEYDSLKKLSDKVFKLSYSKID
ncbi:MAG: hypothetical protein WC307_04370 [Candidatus Nanoarchaeia archaeon]|jgi:hypothetical protein